ncbi:hypothetical protein ACSNN9_00560 [Micromonospora sp. URMC 107]|uniref:hypothetical protein n=1 Tax=Micromonospora sp. URMC 107 TaxID=3423418 RepID=UPI003F1E2E38
MTFRVHYVIPPGAAAEGMLVPSGDDVLVFAQTVEVGPGDRTVEFSLLAAGDGVQIATDIDCTALLRREPEEVAVVQAVDSWVLERAAQAVRIHELLLHWWHQVSSESHRSSLEPLRRWLLAHDRPGDYWKLLGTAAGQPGRGARGGPAFRKGATPAAGVT